MDISYSDKNTSNAICQKKRIKVTVHLSTLDGVKEISRLLTPELRATFAKKYGRILDLLPISVETPALSALAQFWNYSLKCFELPHLDCTPTIEEYAHMIRLPVQENSAVYVNHGRYLTNIKIAELLGLQTNQLKMAERGKTRGIWKNCLEAHLRMLAHQEKWDTFNRVLALVIYGLVLFPFVPDMVDQTAMDVFFMFESQRANPVPAILAETFFSLGFCHREKGGKLRGSAHMLYVWVMTHMYGRNYMDRFADPLKSFHHIVIRQFGAYEWIEEFNKIKAETFSWVCPWYDYDRVIVSCGNFSNVPLMGPRSCVSYTPLLVLRQLQWTQGVPEEGRLGGFCFSYQDDEETKKKVREIKVAWKNIRIWGKKELGKRIVAHVEAYEMWREAREKSDVTCKPVSRNEDNSQINGQLTRQLESMKAQMGVMEQGKQTAEHEIILLKDRCQKLEKEIEHLKRTNAEEISDHKRQTQKGKRKMEEDLGTAYQKIHALEERVQLRGKKLLELARENEVLENINQGYNEEKEALKNDIRALQWQLFHLKNENSRGWEMVEDMAVKLREQVEKEKGWIRLAQELGKEKDHWMKEYMDMISDLNQQIDGFIFLFDKANKFTHSANIPPDVASFIDFCQKTTNKFRKKEIKTIQWKN